MTRSLRLVALCVVSLAPLVSLAQPAPPPPAPAPPPPTAPPPTGAEDPKLAEAKVHFTQGVALFNDGNFSAALAEFEAAYKLHPAPAFLYNIGLTQKALFRYGDAIESLQRYKSEDNKILPERRAEVDQLMTEMKALLADVTVNIEPAGANVTVDGRTVGQAPLSKALAIAAGNHVLEITADGFKPVRKELMISAGVPLNLNVKLELIPKSAKVRITAKPAEALVAVDGKMLGYQPQELELISGGHRLEVTHPKFLPHKSELVIAAGVNRTVDVSLDKLPTRWYQAWYFWTPVTLAVAGLAVGLGVGLTPQGPLIGTLGTGVGRVN